ncbi:MAG: hypothetical protein K2Y71_29300 [Xanthobacteraceae bacterium]|nr:hypothetical protein [Xanthobacteraceae bacterium]
MSDLTGRHRIELVLLVKNLAVQRAAVARFRQAVGDHDMSRRRLRRPRSEP